MSATARPLAPPATATPRTRGAIALIALLLSHTALAQLNSSNSRLLLRNTTDGLPFAVLGRLEHGVPGFGEAMAVGDFNDDGVDDLVVAIPQQILGSTPRGGVLVIYGRRAQPPSLPIAIFANGFE